MTNQDTQGYPDVRPIDAVVCDMETIAIACENDAQLPTADQFERALSLILELRVPRVPNTNEQLIDLLQQPDDEPSLDTKEVFRRLQIHANEFSVFLASYRAVISSSDWDAAVQHLTPTGISGAPAWEGAACRIQVRPNGDRTIAEIDDGNRQVQCISPVPALATLGAVMRAHARWPEIRRR